MDANLSTKLEMFISAKDVPRSDVLSDSDPFVVISSKDPHSGTWRELGRTETKKNEHNPVFAQRFLVTYHFEQNQEFRLDLYDEDSKSKNLNDHDYLGAWEFTLADVVAGPVQSLTGEVKFRKASAHHTFLTVKVEELQECNEIVQLQITGSKLPKMDLFGKSDPFLEFHRIREDNTWVNVHETEVVKKNLNPVWRPFDIKVQRLCNGDHSRPIKVKCYDWDKNGGNDEIGEFETTLREILSANGPSMHELTYVNKKGKRKSRGSIIIMSKLRKEYTFNDYLKGGMQIGLQVAIDFTGSNGHPNDPSSLHYMHAGPNQYVQAINTIGNIVAHYDHDKKFPVWGFGGKVNSRVSHCFPLTFNPNDPEVHGIQGILNAYGNAFHHVKLSGPTYFSEIINTSATLAAAPYGPNHQHYTILLILTDGVINDMKNTISALVNASDKPLSVIIVGVGQANFGQMEVLDGDDAKLRDASGKVAQRDIVQFVPFRDASNSNRLAEVTLAEVPRQVLSFAHRHGVVPLGE